MSKYNTKPTKFKVRNLNSGLINKEALYYRKYGHSTKDLLKAINMTKTDEESDLFI